MNTPIDRIKSDLMDFSERVSNYIANKNDPAKCKNLCEIAYEGLYKFKERVEKEFRNRQKSNLTKSQISQLEKMFDDNFLIGLLKIRNVATHITPDKNDKSEGLVVFTPKNEQLLIECETSAGALFTNNVFPIKKSNSGVGDHAYFLTEAVNRLQKKVDKLA